MNINERLGVPDGLIDISNKIYSGIISNINSARYKISKDNKNYRYPTIEHILSFPLDMRSRKLYKLFDMSKDTKTNNINTKINNKPKAKIKARNESILNWDKFQYAIGVNKNISKDKYI